MITSLIKVELIIQNDADHRFVIIHARMIGNEEGALIEVARGSTIETAFSCLVPKLGL